MLRQIETEGQAALDEAVEQEADAGEQGSEGAADAEDTSQEAAQETTQGQ